jgi:predicted negative regulator of RcsB-dependent stress response
MASHLDLEEQEQLDQLKAFWNRFGNLITWVLIAVLAAAAAWNGYQYWQRSQASQAAAMLDEVQKIAQSGDPEKSLRAFTDMKERFGKTAYAAQAGLEIGKQLFDAGKTDSAIVVFQWVVDNAADAGYASVARLRLAGILVENKQEAQALKLLDSGIAAEFAALAADRRGDILILQGEKDKAKTQYQTAYAGLDAQDQYRRLVEVKLNALGIDPSATATSSKDSAPVAAPTT